MKKLTKILTLLLAVALVCTGLALAVSANNGTSETASYVVDGETKTGTLAEALAAADEETTVTLMGDCTLEETFTVTKSLTVDLNGYELVAKTDAFVIGESDIEFNIVGTGSMTLGGKLASATADFEKFTFAVEGTEMTAGIDITHTNSNIVSTYHGDWYFKNIDIVTTSKLAKTDAYFLNVRDNTAMAYWSFEFVSFDATAVPYAAPDDKYSAGNFVVSVAGDTYLDISNSAFRTQNSGINAGHGYKGGEVTGQIEIVDSVISCVSHAVFKKDQRNYVLLGMDYNFTGNQKEGWGVDFEKDGFNGVLNVENSLLECNSRVFCCGEVDEPTINLYDSTIRVVGIYGADSAYGFTRGKVALTLDGKCTLISADESIKFNDPPVGTRANIVKCLSNLTGGKVVAYDPVGNMEAPYVVVKEDDVSPDFYKDFGFDTIDFGPDKKYDAEKSTGSRDLYVDNKSTGIWDSDDPYWFKGDGGMQWDARFGTITHVLDESSSYVRYWIQPDPEKPNDTTRTWVNDKANNINYDTYLIMGLDSSGNYTKGGSIHASALSGDNRKSVMLVEFDFGTDSEVGYPTFDVTPQTRNNANTGANRNRIFTITKNGSITNTGELRDKPDVMPTLNPTGEWNRLSLVCYSDPANSFGLVYVYLNGEYMGNVPLYTTVENSQYYYFQGVRLNMSKTQNVNASLIVDNVSFRAYTEYQFDGEKDSTFTVTDGVTTYNNDGVYFPEKYIIADPAKRSIDPTITVGGVSFNDVNDALAFVDKGGALVDIHSDMTLTVTENGIINTNGYNVKFTDDSYGYLQDGNYVEFSEDYQYTAYFYTGDLDKLDNGEYEPNEADFEKVIVKLGDYLTKDVVYKGEITRNFETMTVSGAQSGWVLDPDATTGSVLPKLVTLDDIALAGNEQIIYYYPCFETVAMTYYVKDAEGTIYAGDATSEQALIDFQNLKNGDTFVLLGNVNISEADTYFANTTDTTEQVINIDLNGNTLSLSERGALVRVGSYTTLNVYSTKPGAMVNCATYDGSKIYGNYAFVIDDPTVTNIDSGLVYADNVKSAKINVGTIEALGTDGSNMVIIAETALQGRIGDDDCRIVCDGVDIYSPSDDGKGEHKDTPMIDTKLYNGEVYVKNALLVSLVKDNVVNVQGFYTRSKTTTPDGVEHDANKPYKDADDNEIELSNRIPGFENGIVTPYMELENCMIINSPTGFNDGKNNNVVGNNGDGCKERQNLMFKNVVTTGRFNPSNVSRSAVEGFFAAEKFDISSGTAHIQEGTKIGNYKAPMTFDALDLGIETVNGVLNITIGYYDATENRMINVLEYNIANTGVEPTGTNAYVLPMLTKGTAYEEDFVNVTWVDLKGEKLDGYEVIKGSQFTDKTGLNVANVDGTIMSLAWDGTFTEAPEYVTESITLTPGYTVTTNLTGFKANLSLYSDFNVNIYIPAEYMDYITVDGYTLTDAALNDVAYKMLTVTQACNETTDSIVVTINITESVNGVEYKDTKTIEYSVEIYANTVLSSETLTDADKVLAYYMVAYANAATAYVDGEADETLTAMLDTYAKFAELYVADDEAVDVVDTANLSAVFSSVTVTLDPNPAFVLTVKEGFVGTVVVKYGNSARTYTIGENTKRDIVIEGMKIYSFAQMLSITAEGTINGEAATVTDGAYTLDTFAKYHSENAETDETSAAVMPLINALVDYVNVAKAYKNGDLLK